MTEGKMVPGPVTWVSDPKNPWRPNPKWKNYAQWEWRGIPIKQLSKDALIEALTETMETLSSYRASEFDRHQAFGKMLDAKCKELRDDIEAALPSREQQAENLEELIDRAAYKS